MLPKLQHPKDENNSIKSKLEYKDKSIRNQRKQTEAKRLEERNKAAARKKAEKTKSWSIQKDKVSIVYIIVTSSYRIPITILLYNKPGFIH